jgi:threonine dehydrogenase-like Zn-dependent dehydrogenase
VRTGAVDPVAILTEMEPLSDVIAAYEAFDQREPGWIKVELQAAE